MIMLKSEEQIKLMSESGRIAITALKKAMRAAKPGVTTAQLDMIVKKYIEKEGAKPSFLGYGGFPASACISVNTELIHGIPSEKTVLKDGDIVSIDVGAYKNGYHGDCARTFGIGNISDEAKKIIDVTRQSFYEGIKLARTGYKISDISSAVQQHIEKNGFFVVKNFVGHGIGQKLHESPEVPNYVDGNSKSLELKVGMTLAIEPMVNTSSEKIKILSDGWTVVTADGLISAHYENTIAITDNEALILTKEKL